jgi:hypothetical protein
MSKKTLLNETTVRRFMKLANTQPLADNFVNEMGGYAAKAHEDEEEAPEDMGPMDEPIGDEPADEPMDAMDADEPAADEPVDALDDEPEADMDMADDAEEVEISEDDRDVLAQAAEILNKIAGGGGADMDMGDDAGMRDAMVQEEEALEGETLEEEAVEEGKHTGDDEEVNIMDEDQLVQEVTRRVADKLRAAIKSRE